MCEVDHNLPHAMSEMLYRYNMEVALCTFYYHLRQVMKVGEKQCCFTAQTNIVPQFSWPSSWQLAGELHAIYIIYIASMQLVSGQKTAILLFLIPSAQTVVLAQIWWHSSKRTAQELSNALFLGLLTKIVSGRMAPFRRNIEFRFIWPLITSGNLNIEVSEKVTDILS